MFQIGLRFIMRIALLRIGSDGMKNKNHEQ